MTEADSSSSAGIVDFPGTQAMTEPVAEWLETARRLSAVTLAKLPVGGGTHYFPDLERRTTAVFFKYPNGWKARSCEEKAFIQKTGTKAAFWNLEAVLEAAPDEVYITEGELDACALVEAGIEATQVLSVPSGSADEMEYAFAALDAGLKNVKMFVLCMDNDSVGGAAQSLLARVLGIPRTSFVNWPEGNKDANDCLRTEGAEVLRDLVTVGRLPWPTYGLYRMSDIPEPAKIIPWETGFDAWREKIYLAPGMLSVVTGHPGHGKTMVFNQIWFQVCQKYDEVACIASFETLAKPELRKMLRTLHAREKEYWLLPEPENPKTGYPGHDGKSHLLAAADRWIEDHYLWLIHPERRPDLKWLLDQATTAVIRHGAKIIQIDPWNRLEAARERNETETEYIGRCLRELYNFARDFNCHVQVMAHPAKSDGHRRGLPPELEDISGSKSWDNMCDQGFVIHRPKMYNEETGTRETYCEFFYKKSRFEALGYPCRLGMDFDLSMGRYYTRDLLKKQQAKKKEEEVKDEK